MEMGMKETEGKPTRPDDRRPRPRTPPDFVSPNWGQEMIETILRRHVLAERYGLRRDKLSDVFKRAGWSNHGFTELPEVCLTFFGQGKTVPPLRARLAAANKVEFTIVDRHGRHWAARRSMWQLGPTEGVLRP
jgi:hypothetical protein